MTRADAARGLFLGFSLMAGVALAPLAAAQDRPSQPPTQIDMLLAGAQANRADVVRHLLDQGIDPNLAAEKGVTALLVAAGAQSVEVAELLLKRGADPNRADDLGWTPLLEAARRDNEEMVRLLLKAGARHDVRSDKGLTPLMIAARGDRPQTVVALLAGGADVHGSDAEHGNTALHLALASARPRAPEIAAELLAAGADPRRPGRDGFTPLMAAVTSAKLAQLTLVLSEHVDVNASTPDGRTALLLAAGLGHGPMVERLLEAGAQADAAPGSSSSATPLTEALRAASYEAAAALLARGADPNRAGGDGRTPLILAVQNGDDATVSLLLEKGAQVNGRNVEDGTTALMWAANSGFESVVRLLLEQGADPALKAKDGWTAGEAARMAGHDEIAKLFERRT